MDRHEGVYINSQYGYRVTVPSGLVGHSAPPPAPNHGFGIVLSWEPRAYVFVDGSYNVLDSTSSSDLAVRRRAYEENEASRILSVKRSRVRLSNLSAVRQVMRYECAGLDGVYVTDAVHLLGSKAIIEYTASLSTREDRYVQDKAVFDRLLRGLRISGQPTVGGRGVK